MFVYECIVKLKSVYFVFVSNMKNWIQSLCLYVGVFKKNGSGHVRSVPTFRLNCWVHMILFSIFFVLAGWGQWWLTFWCKNYSNWCIFDWDTALKVPWHSWRVRFFSKAFLFSISVIFLFQRLAIKIMIWYVYCISLLSKKTITCDI